VIESERERERERERENERVTSAAQSDLIPHHCVSLWERKKFPPVLIFTD